METDGRRDSFDIKMGLATKRRKWGAKKEEIIREGL
jgi:hypothetical protein